MSLAKRRIKELIEAEQARRTITEPYIRELSKADLDELRSLQKQLTVSITLDRGLEDQEPSIHVEGLTRDVFTAEAEVRSANNRRRTRRRVLACSFKRCGLWSSGKSSRNWRGGRT